MTLEPTVFIVDDDSGFAESLSILVTSMGFKTIVFSTADAYLSQFDPKVPGCLILDVRMPKVSGLAVQEQLAKLPQSPSIIIMTGHAEVPIALRAMRQGAVDFLQKTFSEDELFDAIQRAIARDADNRAKFEQHQAIVVRFAQLTDSEREVLNHVLQGTPNKSIATALGISRRTVEDRRARVMQKLGADSLAELVRLAMEVGFQSK